MRTRRDGFGEWNPPGHHAHSFEGDSRMPKLGRYAVRTQQQPRRNITGGACRVWPILAIALIGACLMVGAAQRAAGCTVPWSATYTGSSPWLNLNAGQRATVTLSWQNTGCNAWNINVSGAAAFIGTWNPTPGQDHSSALGGAASCGTPTNWFGCNRVRPVADIVNPGDTASFTFDVIAPAAPGTYQVYFRPLIEGVQWMEDQGVFWQLTVATATGGYSRYESQVDARIPNQPPGTPAGQMYVQGCKAGGDVSALYGGPFTPQTGVVVLDFGRPYHDNAIGYGSMIFSNQAVSTSQVLAAAEAYAKGYWDCSTPTPTITIAVGTNNQTPDTSSVHGAAWAQMVLSFKNWIGSTACASPSGCGSQISAGGASDIELDWNSATTSRNWTCVPSTPGNCSDGYGSVVGTLFYDYGDAAGCPPAGACDNAWTQEDVWYVAWGAPPAEPLPEMYNTTGIQAQQWQQIDIYGLNTHGVQMNIRGTMTQSQACAGQVNGCPGLDNTPQQGWLQMWQHLNDSTDTRTTQQLNWATDITWAN